MDYFPSADVPSAPTSFDFRGLSLFGEGSFTLSSDVLQIMFYISILCTIIFTIILFGHWKKYAPNPVKVFAYGVVYLIVIGILILAQLSLLSLY
jgi:hypothetical protein